MKKTVGTGQMTGPGALGAAAITGSATARTDSYSSCYGDDDCSISRSSHYYWRRWQLQQPNRLLRLWLLLQQRLGRLIETRHESSKITDPAGRRLGDGGGWTGPTGLCPSARAAPALTRTAATRCARRWERRATDPEPASTTRLRPPLPLPTCSRSTRRCRGLRRRHPLIRRSVK